MVSGLYLDVLPYSVKSTSGREGGTQEGGREGERKKEGREGRQRREEERKKEGREGGQRREGERAERQRREGDSYYELQNFTRWTSAIRYQQLK